MMKNYPEDKDDEKDLADLKVEPWMADCLKLNPEYVHWGIGDDYMKGVAKNKDEGGWDSGLRFQTWREFGPWQLDDMNELVHFAFELHRENKNCDTCHATGYHPDAQWLEKSWYKHSSPFAKLSADEKMMTTRFREMLGVERPPDLHAPGSFPSEEILKKYKPEFRAFCLEMQKGDGYWSDKITQDEVDALAEEGRLRDYTHVFEAGKGWKEKPGGAKKHTPTAAEVNAAQNAPKDGRKPGMHGHDSINHWECVKVRCKRFGIPYHCLDCEGSGGVWTAPAGTLGINLWFLHPRKGAQRGIEIRSIEKEELKTVFEYLRDAAKRNADRFGKVIGQL